VCSKSTAAARVNPDRLGLVGEVLDKQARSAYRRRLAEIDADLQQAQSWADTGQAARLAAERDALLDQLRAAIGQAGVARCSAIELPPSTTRYCPVI